MKRIAPIAVALAVFIPCLAFAQNYQTDPNNCGSAGNVCPAQTECSAGVCVTPTGSTPNGQSCYVGSSCQSGYCDTSSGLCAPSPSSASLPSAGSGGITPSGAGGINTAYIAGYATSIKNFINGVLVPLLVALAFITFLWGIYNSFILGATDPKKREEGTQLVLWGVVGFVVIIAFWGLVALVGDTLGLPAGGSAASHGLTPPTL